MRKKSNKTHKICIQKRHHDFLRLANKEFRFLRLCFTLSIRINKLPVITGPQNRLSFDRTKNMAWWYCQFIIQHPILFVSFFRPTNGKRFSIFYGKEIIRVIIHLFYMHVYPKQTYKKRFLTILMYVHIATDLAPGCLKCKCCRNYSEFLILI